MKTKLVIVVLVVLATVVLLGCGSTSSGVVKLSENTYLVSRTSPGGMFADTSALRTATIKDANDFAEKQGKAQVCISMNLERPAHGFPSFDYQFRLVEKGSPEAKGGDVLPSPDVLIEDARTPARTQPTSDLYAELTKLEDLRKRGLLTDAEFEVQKQRLLNR